MSLPTWLQFGNRRSPRVPDSRPRQPLRKSSRRPRLLAVEQLEDRMLPSTFYAATAADLIADIRAANASGGLNSIVLTAPPTSPYVLTAVDNSTDGPTGLPVIAANDNLTIVGNGDTIQRSTAAGAPYFRLLDVASGGSLTLQNLTVQNGVEEGSYARGGGIYNQGSLTLSAVTVQNNAAWAWYGAGGGGIASYGALTIQNGSLIQGNLARGGSSASGGGVYVGGGRADLTGVTLSSNEARGSEIGSYFPYDSAFGGGLCVDGGTVNLSGSTVSGNVAQGGDAWESYWSPPGDLGLQMEVGTSAGNALGGGVYVGGGTVSLRSNTVQNNAAYGGIGYGINYSGWGLGGGIYIERYTWWAFPPPTVYLDSFTVAHTINNTADFGPNICGPYTLR